MVKPPSDSTALPYGHWPSTIDAEDVAKASTRYRQLAVDGETVYWIEQRPEQAGKYLLNQTDGPENKPSQPLTQGYSLRSLVYNYGGGALTVANGQRCFVDCNQDNKQHLYFQDNAGQTQLIAAADSCSYGDLQIDTQRQRVLLIEEQIYADKESSLSLRSYPLKPKHAEDYNSETFTLAAGADFYSSPSLSPDGNYLAFLSWQRPNMPWDNNSLWLLELDSDGRPLPQGAEQLCGPGSDDLSLGESIFQPQWSPDGDYLYFISDRSNWWSLYRYHPATGEQHLVAAIDNAEFASPQWELGMSYYGFLSNDKIAAAFFKDGISHLAIVDCISLSVQEQPLQLQDLGPVTSISHLHIHAGNVVFVAAGKTFPSVPVSYDIQTRRLSPLSALHQADKNFPLSSAEAITFPVVPAAEAHGYFYPPVNPHYCAADSEKIPLLIKSHGGPTSATTASLDLSIQYFTSRGFAVLDINYRGSSGYGRQYRHALYGQWGIADKEDCLAAINYLAKHRHIDKQRVFARGNSAGGYLTLVLASFTKCLKAGASYAGISNLESLYAGTHKFEKFYLQRLLDKDLNCAKQRSPIFATNKITTPLFLVQGRQDKVVPAEQTQQIIAAMEHNGVNVEALFYDNEQHGLRRSENIAAALEQEYQFFLRQL